MKGIIYIVSPSKIPFPSVAYGGIERCILNLYKGFTKIGRKVKVLCNLDMNAPKNPDFISITTTNQQQVFKEYIYHSDEFIQGVLDFIQKNVSKEDFVILNHIEQKRIAQIILKKNIGVLEICHYARNFIGLNKIVFLSRIHKLIGCRKGYIIHLPVDPDIFFNDPSPPIISGEYILSVGRVCQHKRTYQSYKIARYMGLKLVIAGPIQDKIMAEKFLHNCQYMGSCDQNTLRNLYSHAMISTCLTGWIPPETGGLFQVEALMCGSSVLSSKSGGLWDSYEKESCVEYSSYKPISRIAKQIESLVKNRTNDMKLREIEKVRRKYSPEVIARKYLDFINK